MCECSEIACCCVESTKGADSTRNQRGVMDPPYVSYYFVPLATGLCLLCTGNLRAVRAWMESSTPVLYIGVKTRLMKRYSEVDLQYHTRQVLRSCRIFSCQCDECNAKVLRSGRINFCTSWKKEKEMSTSTFEAPEVLARPGVTLSA